MFTRLRLSPAQVSRLRDERGVYMVQDSRINIAGLAEDRLDELAGHIAAPL
jgi:aspartate aminotransferase